MHHGGVPGNVAVQNFRYVLENKATGADHHSYGQQEDSQGDEDRTATD